MTFMRTNIMDIFAAGDVANIPDPILGKRMRFEHEENANLSGVIAGVNMAGEQKTYETTPSVYSTLFDVSYDAVGDLDPELEILYDWQESMQKGTAFYMNKGRVRGVLLWNLSHGLDTAREIIAMPGPSENR